MKILPLPNECNITRIDLTKDIYVGDVVDYIMKQLNKKFLPDLGVSQIILTVKENATFTKHSSKSSTKIFELSFMINMRK